MAALLVLLGLAAVASTEWLRQGTQHLALVGYTVATLLLGAGVGVLPRP